MKERERMQREEARTTGVSEKRELGWENAIGRERKRGNGGGRSFPTDSGLWILPRRLWTTWRIPRDVISPDAIFRDVISCDVISRDVIPCGSLEDSSTPRNVIASFLRRDVNYRLVYPWITIGGVYLNCFMILAENTIPANKTLKVEQSA